MKIFYKAWADDKKNKFFIVQIKREFTIFLFVIKNSVFHEEVKNTVSSFMIEQSLFKDE